MEALGVESEFESEFEPEFESEFKSPATEESRAVEESKEPLFGVKRDMRKVTKASSLVVQSLLMGCAKLRLKSSTICAYLQFIQF
ncbi:hypothetical protein HMPREF1581_01066 [Gardnerella vaginalis JCP8108]|uniref:Uncharacterized protein n=1 Tax=Gardnerella vaginalis JCP8108 TaxID=1261066 RepID=S4GLT9_GARVA|nr:hypothetical protein HMPREF1581_01066 [Gardnerella vaginalis JCP8108]